MGNIASGSLPTRDLETWHLSAVYLLQAPKECFDLVEGSAAVDDAELVPVGEACSPASLVRNLRSEHSNLTTWPTSAGASGLEPMALLQPLVLSWVEEYRVLVFWCPFLGGTLACQGQFSRVGTELVLVSED